MLKNQRLMRLALRARCTLPIEHASLVSGSGQLSLKYPNSATVLPGDSVGWSMAGHLPGRVFESFPESLSLYFFHTSLSDFVLG